MRFGFGAFLFIFPYFSVWAASPPTVDSLKAVGISTTIKTVPKRHVVISDWLPEYDAPTEFLFHYHPSGHGVFYCGGDYRDSNDKAESKPERIIRNGIAVKVTVGADRVQRIQQSMKTVDYRLCKNSYTCQQKIFYLLQDAGISLKDGPYQLGSTTFLKMLHEGFVDEKGRSLPHSVVVLQPEGADFLTSIHQTMESYEIGTSHGFFNNVSKRMGYGNKELLADVRALKPGNNIIAWVESFAESKKEVERPRAELEKAHRVLELAEEKFLTAVRGKLKGISLSELFHYQTHTELSLEYQQGVQKLYRRAMQEALAEVLTPAKNCRKVQGEAS